MRKNLLLVAILALFAVNFANAQTVYFNGLGRAIVTNSSLKGLALDPDTLGSIPDTANTRKGTGGYTLLDLGINAQPSKSLRASAILSVRNEFGGFYGDGSRLIFRQMRLDGILNKVVKYEIGDIDLSMTPYTLYNFAPVYDDYEADIFKIRRSIVQYQNFNFGNNWRVQGFHGSSALAFKKYVQKINISAFGARTRRTNFKDLPDRLLVGGQIGLVQSKHLELGGNYISYFDVENTAPSIITNLKNDVLTGNYKIKNEFGEKLGVALYGEVGTSNFKYDTAKITVENNDYFYDLGASVKYNPLDIKLYGSYRYVGPYFSSPGAQTRRINDFGTPALFPTVGNNEALARTPLLFDRISNEDMRNLAIQPLLMNYLPQYNNITPYGVATPNRKGISIGLTAGGADKKFVADVMLDKLSEVVGEGTSGSDNKRDYFGLKGGASIFINKIIGFEKQIVLNGGFRYENTERKTNAIKLESTLIDAGFSVEILKQLDLMGGYKSLNAKGNEFLAVRNAFNLITGYNNFQLDSKQNIIAAGLRYRFSRNTYFSGQYLWINYNEKAFMFNDYKINQLFLSYTMVF